MPGISRGIIGIGFIALLIIAALPVEAAIRIIPFSAQLKNVSGDAVVDDGTYNVTFRIYSQESGGTADWTETHSVAVTNGIVSVNLGTVAAFPSSLTFNSDPFYLGVQVGSDDEMSPRKRIGAVPAALNADTVDGHHAGTGANEVLVLDESGNADLAAGKELQIGGATVCTAAGCSGAGGAASFVQGGNSFGELATLGTNDNNSLAVETNGTERIRIDASGNVGIGATAGAGVRLQVTGGDTQLGTGTFNNTSGSEDLYVAGNIEADGTIFGTLSGTFNPGFTTGSVIFQGASGLAQSNSQFFWDNSANRLGIGTNTPGTDLHISKGINDGVKLRLQNTTSDTNAFAQMSVLAQNSATNFYALSAGYTTNAQYVAQGGLLEASGIGGLGISALSTSGVIRFHTNSAGAERMRIDSTGNVGIGATTVATQLHVQGNGANNARFALEQTAAGGNRWDLISATNALHGVTSGTLLFWNNNQSQVRLAIEAGGNIGIGATVPGNKLEVNIGTSAVVDSGITIQGSTGTKGDMGLRLNNTGTGGIQWYIDSTNNGSDYGGGKLAFAPGIGPVPIMTLTSSTVGIGSTSPTSTLEVKSSATNEQVNIRNNTQYIYMGANSADYVNIGGFKTGTGAIPLALQTAGGNVGINTTTPTLAKLQINQAVGTAAISINGSGSGTTGLIFANGNYGYLDYDTGSAGMRLSSLNLAPLRFGFNTNAAYGSSTFSEALRIDTTGRVGIGVTSGINSALTFAEATTAAGGILFGTDTNLYRDSANVLRTDDQFMLVRAAGSDAGYTTFASGDTFPRINVRADGVITWGPGNGAGDTNIYRSAANTLKTDDSLNIVANLTLDGQFITTPSATQTLAAGDPILANATKVKVAGSGGAVILTSTPTIADGVNGQLLYIQGTDDTNLVTVQDQTITLPSSNLELGAATRVLGKGDVLVLTFDSVDSVWYEISFTNN